MFGYHHFSLLCLSRDLAGLDKAVAELGSCLTDMNINWLREDLNMEASFWAQLPGNHAYIARSCMLSSANFSGFSSLHNFATGQASGVHWGSADLHPRDDIADAVLVQFPPARHRPFPRHRPDRVRARPSR